MKKSLAALIGLALAGTASAELRVYGTIYAELSSEQTGAGAQETEFTRLDDEQNSGRLGFAFSQKVAYGLIARGQYEVRARAAEGEFNAESRAAFVGLESPLYGAISLGRFDGAYKVYGGESFDPFVGTGLQARGQGGMSNSPFGHSGFVSRSVEYKTAKWKGLEGTVQYQAGNSTDQANQPNGDEGSWLAGVRFRRQAYEIIAAAAHNKSLDATNVKLGGRALFGDFVVTLQYEDVEQGGYDLSPSSNAQLAQANGVGEFLFAGVSYRHKNMLWVLQAAQFSAEQENRDALYWALGGRYYFARNIWAVFGYRSTDSDDDTEDTSAAVLGLRYDF